MGELLLTEMTLSLLSPRSVSLLTHFEDCSDPYDWQIGKHGIYLSFSSSASSQRKYTATYLPDVIPAQNWTQDEALASAMRKSGYQGPIDAEFIKSKVKVRRYQSEKVERTVEEWRAWKEEQRGED
jgi:AMME syndrome candidate gene 1 protein